MYIYIYYIDRYIFFSRMIPCPAWRTAPADDPPTFVPGFAPCAPPRDSHQGIHGEFRARRHGQHISKTSPKHRCQWGIPKMYGL